MRRGFHDEGEDDEEMGSDDEERAMAEALELNRKLKALALSGGDDIQAFLQQQMGQQQHFDDDAQARQQEQYARQQQHLEIVASRHSSGALGTTSRVRGVPTQMAGTAWACRFGTGMSHVVIGGLVVLRVESEAATPVRAPRRLTL